MDTMSRQDERACRAALRNVVNSFGSQENLSAFCKVSPQTVSEWVIKSQRVPIQHVEKLCIAMQVPPSELRPDLSEILRNKLIRPRSTDKIKAGTGYVLRS